MTTRIDEIEKRLGAVTKWPWGFDSYSSVASTKIPYIVCRVPIGRGDTATQQGEKDAEFIATAPETIAYLLDIVNTLEEQLKVNEEALAHAIFNLDKRDEALEIAKDALDTIKAAVDTWVARDEKAIDDLLSELDSRDEKIKLLESQLKMVMGTLEFYSNENNWLNYTPHNDVQSFDIWSTPPTHVDRGKKAQEALEKIRGME